MLRHRRRRPEPERDHNTVANTVALVRVTPALQDIQTFRVRENLLSEIEDRRQFHPLGPARPARSLLGQPHSLRLVDRKPSLRQVRAGFTHPSPLQTKARIGFKDPRRVVVCIRRKTRKEVLHAKGFAGGRVRRRRRRNWTSEIHCS